LPASIPASPSQRYDRKWAMLSCRRRRHPHGCRCGRDAAVKGVSPEVSQVSVDSPPQQVGVPAGCCTIGLGARLARSAPAPAHVILGVSTPAAAHVTGWLRILIGTGCVVMAQAAGVAPPSASARPAAVTSDEPVQTSELITPVGKDGHRHC
jgi:hypothetical protein